MRPDEGCRGHVDQNICRFAGQGHVAAVRTANEVMYQGLHRGTPAPIDRLSVLIDTCPFLASCSCHDRRRCLLHGLPAYVSRAECRRCVSAENPEHRLI